MAGIKMIRKLSAAILLMLICPKAGLWAQQIPDEKVIVTASAYPVPFENLSRTVSVLTRDDIRRMPARSIVDVLAALPSLDLRSRAPLGLQTDLSVRGSAFSQVLVLVDGLRINDSQTGHHNGDFPVQLQDVERVEVLYGPGSALYGADAFGGIVNIITRRQTEPGRASISCGQFDFAEGSFGLSLGNGKMTEALSASASRSSGFEYDRDFRSIAINSRTSIGERSGFSASYVNKEFGANGFYGPSPSKEWTNQTMVSLEHRIGKGPNPKTVMESYYRTHGDRFLYDIRTPDLYENRHRTHALGVQIKSRWDLNRKLSLSLGGETGADWIRSNNLGDHAFIRMSVYTEMQWKPISSVAVYSGLRFDHYSNFGPTASPSLSGSWWVGRRLRLRSSVARAFRIPTFTELYYHDPNRQADSQLKPETAWSLEGGADFIPRSGWLGSMTLFERRASNVIDWIRSSALEKWRSSNIRSIEAGGLELGLQRSFLSDASFGLHYSYLQNDAGQVDFISQYALDYARHSYGASALVPLPFSLAFNQTASYRRRADGRSYWILDGRLSRRFGFLSADLDITNMLNSRYQEVLGVNMPGRWITLSLRAVAGHNTN